VEKGYFTDRIDKVQQLTDFLFIKGLGLNGEEGGLWSVVFEELGLNVIEVDQLCENLVGLEMMVVREEGLKYDEKLSRHDNLAI